MPKRPKNPFLLWLIVLLALALLGGALAWAVHALGYPTGGAGIAIATAVLAHLWLLWGLWTGRKNSLVYRLGLIVVGSDAVIGLFVLLTTLGFPQWAMALGGAWAMVLCLIIGLAMIRLILSPGLPLLAVARTVVDEAVRMKIVVLLIVALVLLVPALPFMLNPGELLKYRVMFFLTWSLAGVSVLLSLMTIFLSCWTITAELKDRQIYLTMTKPLGRLPYLTGKWLGIMLLNLLLLAIAGIGIFAFAIILQAQGARDQVDRDAVDTQVMVARQVIRPAPPTGMDMAKIVQERLERLRQEDPEHYGGELTGKQQMGVQGQILALWHAIPTRGAQAYLFHGLQDAHLYTDRVTLRIKPAVSNTPPDEVVRLGIVINRTPFPLDNTGRPMPTLVTAGTFYELQIPVTLIDPQGNLELQVHNVNVLDPENTFPTTVSFTPGEGLELLYQVDSFTNNLLRTLLVIWFRLGFLAVVGLGAGTILGFPMACLVACTVYIAGAAAGFSYDAAAAYANVGQAGQPFWDRLVLVLTDFFNKLIHGEFYELFKLIVVLIQRSFLAIIPALSEYNPTQQLADGRLVSWQFCGDAFTRICILWSGVYGLLAWAIFRRRELARVTV